MIPFRASSEGVEVIDLVIQSGFFGYAALLAGLLGLIGAVLALVLSLLRLRVPVAIWVLLGGLPLVLGFVGALYGAQQIWSIAAGGMWTVGTDVYALGLAASVVAVQIGASTSALVFLGFTWACAVGLVARPGPGARVRPALGVSTALILALIALVVAIAGWSLPTLVYALLTLGLAPAALIAALRWPEDGEDLDKLRIVHGRVGVTFLAALTILSAGVAVASMSWSEVLRCVSIPGVMGEQALAQSLWQAWWVTGVGAIAVGLALLVIALPTVAGRAHLSIGSGLRGTVAVVPLAVLPFLGGLFVWMSLSVLHDIQPVYVHRAAEVHALNSAPPRANLGPNYATFSPRVLLHLGAEGALANGEQVASASDLGTMAAHAIVVSGSTSLDTLAPWLGVASCIVVDSDGLACVQISRGAPFIEDGPEHGDIVVIPTQDGFEVRVHPSREPAAPVSRQELAQQIRGPADGVHDHTIWLKATPSLTVSELVAIFDETWATIEEYDQQYSQLQLQLMP